MGTHRFHGSPERFEVVAHFIAERYGKSIHYIADVAGGQGMLSRVLSKHFNYTSEVIDPRGWTLKGVQSRTEVFSHDSASYYDLIIGLHPDQATRAIAEAALIRPTVLIPCCNYWSDEKLGRDELLEAIEVFYREHNVSYERVTFGFAGPKNIGIISMPALQQ